MQATNCAKKGHCARTAGESRPAGQGGAGEAGDGGGGGGGHILRRSVPLKLLWARGCAARGSAPLVLWCEGHGADRDCCGGASDVDHLQRME